MKFKNGDRVVIKFVSAVWGTPDFPWAIGLTGTFRATKRSWSKDKKDKKYYRVLFDENTNGWDGLWCEEIEPVYVPVTLPKELFEI
jgi:hypothetical protein